MSDSHRSRVPLRDVLGGRADYDAKSDSLTDGGRGGDGLGRGSMCRCTEPACGYAGTGCGHCGTFCLPSPPDRPRTRLAENLTRNLGRGPRSRHSGCNGPSQGRCPRAENARTRPADGLARTGTPRKRTLGPAARRAGVHEGARNRWPPVRRASGTAHRSASDAACPGKKGACTSSARTSGRAPPAAACAPGRPQRASPAPDAGRRTASGCTGNTAANAPAEPSRSGRRRRPAGHLVLSASFDRTEASAFRDGPRFGHHERSEAPRTAIACAASKLTAPGKRRSDPGRHQASAGGGQRG